MSNRKLQKGAKTIPVGRETRHINFAVKDATIDQPNRTMRFPFSSELPVETWFGTEILSHANGAPDLNRLNNGAPLLFNHNPNALIGVVESANLGNDKRCYATVRFSKSPLGDQMFQDALDGILCNVSFGYQINSFEAAGDGSPGDDDADTYIGTSWEIFEISMVSVPADPTVGPGRAENVDLERDVPIHRKTPATAATEQRSNTMTPEEIAAAEAAKTRTTVPAQVADPAVAIRAAITEERGRVAEIIAMGEKCHVPTLARTLANSGATVDEARAKVLDELAKNPTGEQARNVQVLDLSDKDSKSYSLMRAITCAIDKDWKRGGFELECSDAIAKRIGKETNGFFMPVNIKLNEEQQRAAAAMRGQRDLSGTNYAVGTAGAGTTGGTLVTTQLMASEFIEVLRHKARVVQAGARMLSGLVGNVDIPRQTSATSTYWVGEGVDVTESEGAFDKVTLSPKTLGAYSQISRNMMLQSTPDIEVVVRDDLAKVLALAIDLAALSGSGSSGQPKGVLNVSGIGSVVGGTNGAALTIDHLINLESALAVADIDDGAMSYLCNAKTVGTLKTLKSTTGQYLWNNSFNLGMRGPTPGDINGYPVYRTNQLTSAGTKGSASGVTSTLVFGAWDNLFIGEWGVLEILPNPYGVGFKNGGVDIRALQTVDVQVRHATAFAAMTDALTVT